MMLSDGFGRLRRAVDRAAAAQTHEPSWDGIRTIAVFAVMFGHMGVPHTAGGGLGVDVFFVLSGLLITSLLMRESERTGRIDYWRFMKKRLLRLYPALLTLVVFVLIYHGIVGGRRVEITRAGLAVFYLEDFNRAFRWFEGGDFGHTWSLAVEMQFYLVWPLLFMACPKRLRLPGTLLLLAAEWVWRGWLIAHGTPMFRLYNSPDTHTDGLLLGAAAALAGPALAGRLKRPWIPAASIAVLFIFSPAATPAIMLWETPLANLLAAWLLVSIPAPGAVHRALSWAPLSLVGNWYSYSLYLWHVPILIALWPTGHHKLGFATPILTLMAAAASYHLVEKRFSNRRSAVIPQTSGVADHHSPVPA
jgi:peptidoglycan/LPS O-acetylase OafA/YrhL